jgi:high affinity sulfate transporter 1
MRDLFAAVSIAGLLIPESVAYSELAGLPPQAGLVALLTGLVVYGILGSSRFAIVSSTSSSAAVLAATVLAENGTDVATQLAIAAILVAMTGCLFVLAGLARLGGMSDFIARPVVRGFTFGLSLTIVIKQLPKLFVIPVDHGDPLHIVLDLLRGLVHTNVYSLAVGAVALVLLFLIGRRTWAPAALIVIALGIASGYAIDWPGHGVSLVGPIDLQHVHLQIPQLERQAWFRTTELGVAMALLLYAESYGSIRSFALKHGDSVSPDRDLVALGCANIVSGLLYGMPVGAGYSATAANEAAGATSKLAGLAAAVIVALAAWLLLPQLARTPDAVLAAIVIFAVSHSLRLSAFTPYWLWRRDRLVVVAAVLAVLVLGVLHGLLAGIGVSLMLALRKLAEPKLSVLGRLGDSHDFVDLASHADARAEPDVLIVRPEAQLFFANVDRMLGAVRSLVNQARPPVRAILLSLEETPDVDSTAIESLETFAVECRAHGHQLVLARLKPDALRTLRQASESKAGLDAAASLGSAVLSELSVDESLQAWRTFSNAEEQAQGNRQHLS